jgi:hypothetical protein
VWFQIGDCVRGVTPFEHLPPLQIISSLVVRSVQELQQNRGIWDVLLELRKATEFDRNVCIAIKLIIPGVLTPSDYFCNISRFYDTCPWVLTYIVKGWPFRYMNARKLMTLQQAPRKLPWDCCLQVLIQERLFVYPYYNSHSISHLPASLFILFIYFVSCFYKTLLLHISVAKMWCRQMDSYPAANDVRISTS